GNGNGNGAVPGPTAGASAAPPSHAPAPAPAGHRIHAHRSPPTGSGRPTVVVSVSPSATAGGTPLGLRSRGRTGLLSPGLGAAGRQPGTLELAGPLAPGTATLAEASRSSATTSRTGSVTRTATAGAPARRSHHRGSPATDPAATVIEHFINVIPIGVWI